MGATMSVQGIGRLALIIGAALTVASCEPGSGPFASGTEGGDSTAPVPVVKPRAVAEQDVESPGVFSVTGKGLWDGRPSLGGIWVAHSSVTDPERVIIRNPANGKSVVGALFRRERETPGPGLQISSDAAASLGMLAGQPADLSVVALRREAVSVAKPEPEPQPEMAAAVAEPLAPTATVAATPMVQDSTSLAAKAPPPNPKKTAVQAPVAAATATTATSPALEKPARKGLFDFLKKKPKPVDEAPMAAPVATGITSGEIEQKPLDPATEAATAAIEKAEAKPGAASGTPEAVLRRAYIQIGVFTTEVNARFAVEQMKAESMTATAKQGGTSQKPYWRVVVGPAKSIAEREALIARIKLVGYRDAYAVKE